MEKKESSIFVISCNQNKTPPPPREHPNLGGKYGYLQITPLHSFYKYWNIKDYTVYGVFIILTFPSLKEVNFINLSFHCCFHTKAMREQIFFRSAEFGEQCHTKKKKEEEGNRSFHNALLQIGLFHLNLRSVKLHCFKWILSFPGFIIDEASITIYVWWSHCLDVRNKKITQQLVIEQSHCAALRIKESSC